MDKKDTIVGVRLFPEDAQNLAKIAQDLDTSQSRVVRWALAFCTGLDEDGSPCLRPEFRRFVDRARSRSLFA